MNMEKLILCEVDALDLDAALPLVGAYGSDRFGCLVTPNVDHLIRLGEDPEFRRIYSEANFVLLDSRVAARLLRLRNGLRLPVCTGAEPTAALFAGVIKPADRIVVIGGAVPEAQRLRQLFGLRDLRHHDPPMNFWSDASAVEAALNFVEAASPFRFCFLAVGSPQQERLADALRRRGAARGLTLCVGAAINFLTGLERRAPPWMRALALEWLFRLLSDPRRLATRYLVRGPRVLGLLGRATVVSRTAVGRD